MKTYVFLFCIFLLSLLITGGCSGLAGGAADHQTAGESPVIKITQNAPSEPSTSNNAVNSLYFPSNLQYLTDEEKTEAIHIASQATGIAIDPNQAKFIWFGIASGTEMILRYDEGVEKGIPDVAGARDMTFYPAVCISGPYGTWGQGITVVVDLQYKKVIKKEDNLPPRILPTKNPDVK